MDAHISFSKTKQDVKLEGKKTERSTAKKTNSNMLKNKLSKDKKNISNKNKSIKRCPSFI